MAQRMGAGAEPGVGRQPIVRLPTMILKLLSRMLDLWLWNQVCGIGAG